MFYIISTCICINIISFIKFYEYQIIILWIDLPYLLDVGISDVVQIPSMNTYQSYISSVDTQITRKYPDLKLIWADSYSRLRYKVTGDYIHDAVSNGRSPVDCHKTYNTLDHSFICEQSYLGGANDAEFRAAFVTQAHVGGRVNEVFNVFVVFTPLN